MVRDEFVGARLGDIAKFLVRHIGWIGCWRYAADPVDSGADCFCFNLLYLGLLCGQKVKNFIAPVSHNRGLGNYNCSLDRGPYDTLASYLVILA